MANYYRVSPKFWPWARKRGLTDAQTSLAFYLLTCEHRNLEGLYRLPKLYVSADLAWPVKKVEENLTVVLATGFAVYDDDAEMVLIPKALKHQAPTTEKQIIGAVAQLERIPRTSLWDAFRMACESHCPRLAEAIAVRWPCDPDGASHAHATAPADARAGSSSSSSSSSTPPLAPPADAGGGPGHPVNASPGKANPRANGTNPRAVARRQAETESADRSTVAVAALSDVTGSQREWSTLHTALLGAAGESALVASYIADLSPAGLDMDGLLVVDGPAAAWEWATARAQRLLPACCTSTGVKARFATADEHAGLMQRVAA